MNTALNNHKGKWFKIVNGKAIYQNRCLCCNKTHAELKKDFRKFTKNRIELDLASKTRTMILHGFKDHIGTENQGSHYWYTWHGDPCRCCGGAPQTIGELFLAVYSEGQWYCNKCYAENPKDNSGKWIFAPIGQRKYLPDDEEEQTANSVVR